VILSNAERAKRIKKLTKEQKEALFSSISITHKSEFANILASHKGTEKWEFSKYIDHGERLPYVKCECGRTLRYEFVLSHKESKNERSLGINHLQEELNIPEEIAKEVYKKIHTINYDLDEILEKYKEGWSLSPYIESYIKYSNINIRMDIKLLIDVQLPLLDRHVNWLYDQIRKIKDQPEDPLKSLPEEFSGLTQHLRENVLPIVDSHKNARYIITKQDLHYEILKEVNIPRGYFDSDTEFNQYRYGRNFFEVDWAYYSSAYSNNYRSKHYGPKLCTAHTERLPKGYIGLYLIFGYKSFSQLQTEAKQFIEENNLHEKPRDSYNTFFNLRNDYIEKIDYLKLHEFQMEIGKLGEAFVYDYERNKLKETPFYSKIDNTKADDPTNGYDILSFEKEGIPLYIEVKASARINEGFFISNHELQVSKYFKSKGKNYIVYHVENILSNNINDIIINKIIDIESEVQMEPINWKVTLIK
jgi:hypothetical protein